jgi:peptidoglycan DL-endopeptidase RipA
MSKQNPQAGAEAADKAAADKAAADKAAADKAAADKAAADKAAADKAAAIEVMSSNGSVHTVTDGVEAWKHEGDPKSAVAPRFAGRAQTANSAEASAEAQTPTRTTATEIARSDTHRVMSDGVRPWKEELASSAAEGGAA